MHLAWILLLVLLGLVVLCISTVIGIGLGAKKHIDSRRQTELRSMLEHFTARMHYYNLPYFLDFGTLLGHVREKDIILHDIDVDLGTFVDEINKDTFTSFKQEMSSMFFIRHAPTIVQFYLKANTNLNLDLYLYEGSEEKTLQWRHIVSAKDAILPLQQVPFGEGQHGFDVWIPQNAHQVLVDRYGEDYMTPKTWDKGKDGGATNRLKAIGMDIGLTWRDLVNYKKPMHYSPADQQAQERLVAEYRTQKPRDLNREDVLEEDVLEEEEEDNINERSTTPSPASTAED